MTHDYKPGHLWDEPATDTQTPVECLGMTFANDEARRAYFLEKLREKLRDPEFHAITGFPEGDDETILRLSDPPYYTACPNPFMSEFMAHYGKLYKPDEPYSREPFAVDVSEGKTDALYTAHSYHTKVPYKAIVRAILNYTQPGDVVLDGFAGSGMTGVAAQMCAHPNRDFAMTVESEWQAAGREKPCWGTRRVVLNDLGPAATFISANYNLPFDVHSFEGAARRILRELKDELGWMYETLHTDGKTRGQINYTVWSEVFACPNCGNEITFLKEALDTETYRVRDMFPCPSCDKALDKNSLQRIFETDANPATGSPWRRVRFKPVRINYTVGKERYEKDVDQNDLDRLQQIASLPFPPSVPINRFPIEQMYHGSRIGPKGFTHIHHFYLPRAAQSLGTLWAKASAVSDTRLRHILLFFVEQAIWGLSVLNRYGPTHFSQVNRQLTGVYYIASQHAEVSPWYNLQGKLDRLIKTFHQSFAESSYALISTGTAASLDLPDKSIDYIFTDPPFGENIYYADLNFLVESWHRVWTNAVPEAIIDKAKGKELADYQDLMQQCFTEYFRVLKPGRWMTVVFHNSRNAIWNAIQEAMLVAGFVVADVRTMDKQQGSYRQVTSTAVKQDLVISAYKPNGGLEERFQLEAGTKEGVWAFVHTHLSQLPVFVQTRDGRADVIAERLNYMLFDRMVAFHVQRGVTIPLSAPEFYVGLEQRYPHRDSMYFLSEQVVEYDKKRMTAQEVRQLQIFVIDESSAIQWIRQQLSRKPQTSQDLQPEFMRETMVWQKYEKRPELLDLLEQNFLCYDGKGDVSNQIHSYLSSNFKELRNLAKDNPILRAKAKDRWYVPDVNKASDLEKLRERALLREFEEYRQATEKKLRVFRLEAVRAGFKRAWQNRDYETIIKIAQKIPDEALQEDAKLLMWYDQALTRSERT